MSSINNTDSIGQFGRFSERAEAEADRQGTEYIADITTNLEEPVIQLMPMNQVLNLGHLNSSRIRPREFEENKQTPKMHRFDHVGQRDRF